MKRIIIFMMLIFTSLGFAEKLTTDGKDNLNYLKGYWDSFASNIYKMGNHWRIEGYGIENDVQLFKYKPGVFKYNASDEYNKYPDDYIAWDTKYKTLVFVDKNLNILSKEQRIVKCVQDGTCD